MFKVVELSSLCEGDDNWMMTLLDDFAADDEDEDNSSVDKRSADDDIETDSTNIQSSCRLEMWQCVSELLESGIKFLSKPEDISTTLSHLLYKAVFHGGLKSKWSSVMEVRKVISIFSNYKIFRSKVLEI